MLRDCPISIGEMQQILKTIAHVRSLVIPSLFGNVCNIGRFLHSIQCTVLFGENPALYIKREERGILQIEYATSEKHNNLEGWPYAHSHPGSNTNYLFPLQRYHIMVSRWF